MPQKSAKRLFAKGERIPDLKFEQFYAGMGYKLIAGVDEAGRGPLAGPVVAAAVILPVSIAEGSRLRDVRDSKKLNHKQREELYVFIMKESVAVSVGEATPEEIDRFNIFNASILAMGRAVETLDPLPDFCLVDGIRGLPYPDSKPITKGDAICMSIAAASIIAKVTRDRMMFELHKVYPQYRFDKNKGYATQEHKQALYENGPTPIHRLTFEPVKVCRRRG
jgi:ribonuclease HII